MRVSSSAQREACAIDCGVRPIVIVAGCLLAACAPGVAAPLDAAPADAARLDAAELDARESADALALDAMALDAMVLDAFAPDAATGCPVTLPTPLTFTLAHGAFPGSGHPDVAVHVPAGLDACAPVGAIVYFHGFDNCVLNTIGSTSGTCTPGGSVRTAHHLVEQLDAAHVNAILIAVEVAYDEASGATGALANDGGLSALLRELFDDHLSAMLGRPTSLDDLDRVLIASHSGGYTAVARALDRGHVPHVSEVMLFDSLYGEIPVYEAYTTGQLDRFDPSAAAPLRFAMVFTDGGGTDAHSRALASEIESGLGAIGHADWLLFDDTTATLETAAFDHPLIVKHSMLSHDGVVLYYFQRFVAAAGLAPL
jgi:hypothetical protein